MYDALFEIDRIIITINDIVVVSKSNQHGVEGEGGRMLWIIVLLSQFISAQPLQTMQRRRGACIEPSKTSSRETSLFDCTNGHKTCMSLDG
mmetsp:Transcript_4690/g.7096  ORF Transcript_4690/g.7096 Transcript_4690/m.7096 type:complete len:91 (+) Transcript_4690:329-601(+)